MSISSMKQYWRIFTLLGLFPALLSCGGGIPSTPQNFTATASNQQVTLSWTVEEDETYTLFRSTDSNFVTSDETKISDNVTSPHHDMNLTNGTTYYYRLTAVNSSGTSAPTDEVSATPLLETPQNFTATSLIFARRVTLTWTEEEGVTYTLFRSTDSNFVTSDETKISDNVTSPHDDMNLTNGTTYYYRLTATKEPFGTSAPTDEVSATPLLRAVHNFTAGAFDRRVTLTWAAEEGVIYTLFRSTVSNFVISDETKISDNVTSPHDDMNLTNGTTYYYRLTAVNFLVGASESTGEVSATPLLRTPQNFMARAFNRRVTLTWAAEEGVTYTLFRSTVQGFDVNDMDSGTVMEFSGLTTSLYHDRGLMNDTTYYYRLTANSVSPANEPLASAPADEVSATPSLKTPQNFTARAFHQRVTLTWTAGEAIKGDVPVTYTLHRSNTPNRLELIVSENAASPYHDESVTNGTTYYYRLTANSVSAADEPLASELTDEVSATPSLTPQNFTARAFDRRVTLTWTTDENVTYTLFRSTDSNFSTEGGTEISDNAASPYDDESLTNGQTYYYRLRASFSGDTSEPTDEVSATPLLRTPQNFAAAAFSGQVTLSWAQEAGVTYDLFYSIRAGFALERGIKTSGVTPPHTPTMLVDNVTYYFRLTANSVSATNEPIASAPTDEVSATPQTQLSAGGRHTCAVVGGGAKCWGRGKEGQLGNHLLTGRTPMDSNTPVRVVRIDQDERVRPLISGVAQISAGDRHTCAVVEGRALCWGRGHFGELGHNEGAREMDETDETDEMETADEMAVRLAKDSLEIGYATGDSAGSVTKNITLATTGANGVSISWESSNTDKISTTGTVVRTSGRDVRVTLTATLTKGSESDTKRFALIVTDANRTDDERHVRLAKNSLEIGYAVRGSVGYVSRFSRDSASSVTKDITLATTGANGVSISWASTPTGIVSGSGVVTRPGGRDVEVTLTATLTKGSESDTKEFTLTVIEAGRHVYDIFFDPRRAGKTTPTQVFGLTSGVTQISTGDFHTCALVNGAAWCWGSSFFGQLGNGQVAGHAQSDAVVPQQVMGLTSGVTQISAGRKHTCAVVEGRAFCWGKGISGQLGNNSDSNASTPRQVMGLTSGVTQISAGDSHTCAVVKGAAWCWGENAFLQLGNNAKEHTLVPKQVTGLTSGVTQISAGGRHTCAVVKGRALCWGEGGDGRLGHNDRGNKEADKSRPTQVMGLRSGVTQISAGDFHTCAVVNGSVQCWGESGSGQLGRDTTAHSDPVPVSGF